MPLLIETYFEHRGIGAADTDYIEHYDTPYIEIGDSYVLARVTNDPNPNTYNTWKNWCIRFDPLSYRMQYDHGGFCKMSTGTVVFSLELFENYGWPPPRDLELVVYYTPDNEDNKVMLWHGKAYFMEDSIEPSSAGVTFELRDLDYEGEILTDSVDYNGNDISLAMALGNVSERPCTKLPDYDAGSTAGNSPHYSMHSVEGLIGNDVLISDDGVDISENAIELDDGTFFLTEVPIGEVTISGQNYSIGTLNELFTYAADILDLTFDSTYAQSPSPSINYWIDSQEDLLEFLSKVSALIEIL